MKKIVMAVAVMTLAAGVARADISVVDSRVAPDDGSRGVYRFDEARGATTFVGSGADATAPLTASGSVTAAALGLQGNRCVAVAAGGSLFTTSTMDDEFQTGTISFFVNYRTIVGAGGQGGFLLTKLANDGYSDPYYSVSVQANSQNFGVGLLVNANPRTYVWANMPSAGVSLFAWHHVAAVFDGTAGTLKLYVDGTLRSSTTVAPFAVQYVNHGPWVVGQIPGSGGGPAFFLQDLRLENVTRSDAYLLDYARRGLSLFLTTLSF